MNIQKINEAEKILKETEVKKKVSLGQLSALNRQIKTYENQIHFYNKEIVYLDEEINEKEEIILSLEADLQRLKDEYAEMIYQASKFNSKHMYLAYIFSSETFNQFFMRLKYLEQYAEARRTQVIEIEEVKKTLLVQKEEVEERKLEQKTVLNQKIIESQNLESLKKKQSVVIDKLGREEVRLKKELASRKKAISRLDNLISDLVKREIKESAKKGVSSNKITLTPEAQALSKSFGENKLKLLWPVKEGFVSQKFGKHPHPVLRGVMVENLGVDIQTHNNQGVRVVFDGKVSVVASVPGMNKVVIVQHGEYHTVYARLKSVSVKTGQKVKARDVLGLVYTDKDGISEVQFQIWKNNEKLNPQLWLTTKK